MKSLSLLAGRIVARFEAYAMHDHRETITLIYCDETVKRALNAQTKLKKIAYPSIGCVFADVIITKLSCVGSNFNFI